MPRHCSFTAMTSDSRSSVGSAAAHGSTRVLLFERLILPAAAQMALGHVQ
jgi:ABC-type arginine/histidine transport system permease subunit